MKYYSDVKKNKMDIGRKMYGHRDRYVKQNNRNSE